MEKLDQLFDRLEASKVILKLENSKTEWNHVAALSSLAPGSPSGTFELALIKAINEIKRQITKHKNKLF